MSPRLAWKLGLGIAGTLTALASEPLGIPWLFPIGLGVVVVALLLPARPGQSWREKWSALARHLPLARWFRRDSDPAER